MGLFFGAGGPAAAAIARGESLCQALASERTIPAHHTALIGAAEAAGRTAAALRRLAGDLDREAAARRVFIARAIYPLVVLHLIAPFTSTGWLLKDPTVFAQRTFGAWAAIWAITAVMVFTIRNLRRSAAGTRRLCGLPIVGRVVRLETNLRFLRTIAVLYGAGVRIDLAFAQAITAHGDVVPFDDHRHAADLLRRGEPIDQAVQALTSLDPGDRTRLVTAGAIGTLERALDETVGHLERDLDAAMQRMAAVTGWCLYALAIVIATAAILDFYAGYFAQFESR